jgi:hypothetical protein
MVACACAPHDVLQTTRVINRIVDLLSDHYSEDQALAAIHNYEGGLTRAIQSLGLRTAYQLLVREHEGGNLRARIEGVASDVA